MFLIRIIMRGSGLMAIAGTEVLLLTAIANA